MQNTVKYITLDACEVVGSYPSKTAMIADIEEKLCQAVRENGIDGARSAFDNARDCAQRMAGYEIDTLLIITGEQVTSLNFQELETFLSQQNFTEALVDACEDELERYESENDAISDMHSDYYAMCGAQA